MGKFAVFNESKEWVAHDYSNIFFRQAMSSGERLVIGPSSEHVEVMLALAQTWHTQQFYLQVFFYSYETFLESDGRHHIWIGSPSNDGLLIYDQHNVVFAYGDLQRYEQVLASRSFTRGEFWFPCPHSHSYPATNGISRGSIHRFRRAMSGIELNVRATTGKWKMKDVKWCEAGPRAQSEHR
jgi:hypothetical protein